MLVEAFGWTPNQCKELTIRERKYWVSYLDYKKKLAQHQKLMSPTQG